MNSAHNGTLSTISSLRQWHLPRPPRLPILPQEPHGYRHRRQWHIRELHDESAIAESPERWSKIYCLSRRPPTIPGGLPDSVEHIPLDFLKSPEEIANVLKEKGVKADYVFFFSYIQIEPKEGEALWSNAEEMCKVNSMYEGTVG